MRQNFHTPTAKANIETIHHKNKNKKTLQLVHIQKKT